MRNKTIDPHRRRFVRGAFTGVIAIPFAGLLGTRTADAADMPKLDPDNGQAKALNYVHDAATNPAFQEGSNCGNCVQWTGGDSDWGGCNIFPGKAVAREGWCTAWAPQG